MTDCGKMPQHHVSITYACSCDRHLSLWDLFYCEHCRKLKCHSCGLSEIEWYYCPHCLEKLATGEAVLKRMCCTKCFQCPSCFCALNTASSKDGSCFFVCPYCRWDSRPSGLVHHSIEDLYFSINSNEKRLPAVENQIKDISTHWNKLNLRQKTGRKVSLGGGSPRRFYSHSLLSDALMQGGDQSGGDNDQPLTLVELEEALDKKRELQPQVPQVDVDVASPSIAAASPPLESDTVAQQWRHVSPTVHQQPLPYPLQASLALRCTECERLLVSKEMNTAAAIRFKRALLAANVVPRLSVRGPIPPFEAAASSSTRSLSLLLRNPRDVAIQVRLTPHSAAQATQWLSVGSYDELVALDPSLSTPTPRTQLPEGVIEQTHNLLAVSCQLPASADGVDCVLSLDWKSGDDDDEDSIVHHLQCHLVVRKQ